MKLSGLSIALLASMGLLAEANIPGTVTITSFGTHKYGRFDDTRQVTKTTHIKSYPNAAAAGPGVPGIPGVSNFGPFKRAGLAGGAGVVAGALLLL